MELILVIKGAIEVISTAELIRQNQRDVNLSISIFDDLADADIVQANDHLRSAFQVSDVTVRKDRIYLAASCYSSASLKQLAAYRKGIYAWFRNTDKILNNSSFAIGYMLQAIVCYTYLCDHQQVSDISRRVGTVYYRHYYSLKEHWDCKISRFMSREQSDNREFKLMALQKEEESLIELFVTLGYDRWLPIRKYWESPGELRLSGRLPMIGWRRWYIHGATRKNEVPIIFSAPELNLPDFSNSSKKE